MPNNRTVGHFHLAYPRHSVPSSDGQEVMYAWRHFQTTLNSSSTRACMEGKGSDDVMLLFILTPPLSLSVSLGLFLTGSSEGLDESPFLHKSSLYSFSLSASHDNTASELL